MRGSSGIRRTRLSTSDFSDIINKWDLLKYVPPRLEVSAVAKRTKKATTKTRRHKSAANTTRRWVQGRGRERSAGNSGGFRGIISGAASGSKRGQRGRCERRE